MMKQLLFAATISAGLAYAPVVLAQATSMEKPMMKDEKMMDKKPMAKPASDKMKKDGMMDKKGGMSSDKMKK
jgi:pentapeptide MXKDX repeat protein